MALSCPPWIARPRAVTPLVCRWSTSTPADLIRCLGRWGEGQRRSTAAAVTGNTGQAGPAPDDVSMPLSSREQQGGVTLPIVDIRLGTHLQQRLQTPTGLEQRKRVGPRQKCRRQGERNTSSPHRDGVDVPVLGSQHEGGLLLVPCELVKRDDALGEQVPEDAAGSRESRQVDRMQPTRA